MSASGGDPKPLWTAVDAFADEALGGDDADLAAARRASAEAGLPDIAVSAQQGRMLRIMATMAGARRIVEVGTLGGYSTLHLARALPPDGRLVTLELEPRHAEVARANLLRAGFGEQVQVQVGPAADSLEAMSREGAEAFDFAFIDADKASYPRYLELLVPLMRPGGVIVADNVVRRGAVLDLDGDANARGARAFIQAVGREPRLRGAVVQTVGDKGHDGFLLAVLA